MLRELPWPGNVRELANTLQNALIFSRGYPIRPEDISRAINPPTESSLTEDADRVIRQWIRESLTIGSHKKDLFSELSDHFMYLLLSETMELTGGNPSQAAKLLGISRPTLHSKMEKCGKMRPKNCLQNAGNLWPM